MKPLVVFADPEAKVVNYLKSTLVPRLEAYAPATVTTSFPMTLTTRPHIQVELESGNADDYPVTERAQVRVTCWAPPGKRTDAKALASLAQAFVYTYSDADVAGCDILIGRSDVITDPDTKNLMCWFLARVNLKATLLAS
jgi:hypothetical protein